MGVGVTDSKKVTVESTAVVYKPTTYKVYCNLNVFFAAGSPNQEIQSPFKSLFCVNFLAPIFTIPLCLYPRITEVYDKIPICLPTRAELLRTMQAPPSMSTLRKLIMGGGLSRPKSLS